ncbi:MAG: RNA polymerase factor sigma-54 [Prevotellaceae bacterium]|nr:RNA polymerase factor sigma-54 [Candidatus Faecinaster equi]
MEQGFSQREKQVQTQGQKQRLTSVQVQLIKMLEPSLADFEQRVVDEMKDNEALVADENEEMSSEENNDYEKGSNDYDDKNDQYDEEDIFESTKEQNQRATGGGIDKFQVTTFAEENTLYEELIQQASECDINEKQLKILKYLIGSLDDSGLLTKQLYAISDELELYQGLGVSVEEVREMLALLQSFEPCGIGAISQQDSFLIQLKNKKKNFKYRDIEIDIIEKHYLHFMYKHFDKLKQLHKLSDEQMRDVYDEMRKKLNPRPGNGLHENGGNLLSQIVPDFIVRINDNGFLIEVNRGNVPTLSVSESFMESLDQYSKNPDGMSKPQKEAFEYVKYKVDKAQNFINAIKQRYDTMNRVIRVIVDVQRDFFVTGDDTTLKPMILKDLADKIGVDISTISRICKDKYVDTDYGILPLKKFFSSTFVTQEGEELAKGEILNKLKKLIDEEDKKKPLTDEKLADLMKEDGLLVARRTIAKYRENVLGIPVARLRKE